MFETCVKEAPSTKSCVLDGLAKRHWNENQGFASNILHSSGLACSWLLWIVFVSAAMYV